MKKPDFEELGRTKMKISIVTISFNQVEFLLECINSVLSQKDENLEYIVVDPGSTDGSRELIEGFRGKIDKIVFEPDSGPAHGLNNGFRVASGEVGFFLNSDDYLLPGAVSRIRADWENTKKPNVLLARGWLKDERHSPHRIRMLRSARFNNYELHNSLTVMVQQGMTFSLDAFRSVNGFNERNNTSWDFELLSSLYGLNPELVRFSKSRIGVFRIHSKSITSGSGGVSVQQRFDGDLFRIKKTRSDQNKSMHGLPFFFRYQKYLRNPVFAVGVAIDLLFPSLARYRFEKDSRKD